MTVKKKSNGTPPKQIRFHYLKSNYFRVVHIDGAIGGVTPEGYIHASMYSERLAIPREQSFAIDENGALGELKDTLTRDGVVREMEIDAIMNIESAKSLRDWLTSNIERAEKRNKEMKK